MQHKKRLALMALFSQKSTMIGFAGLAVSGLNMFGLDLDHQVEDNIAEIMLVLVSVTAILTQPAINIKDDRSDDDKHTRSDDSGNNNINFDDGFYVESENDASKEERKSRGEEQKH